MAGLFSKKQKIEQKSNKPEYVALPQPKYSFVEQYTVMDPKRVLNGGYELFGGCATIPVACEGHMTDGGFVKCVMLPTGIVLDFLRALKRAPSETIAEPKMRTISIINLSKNQRIVVGPTFDAPKMPTFWAADSKEKGDWVFHVTPEKNRAIVEQLKMYTR